MTENLHIRRATADDVATLDAIARAAYGPWVELIGMNPQPLQVDYADIARDFDCYLLEHDDNEAIGSLILRRETDHLLIWSVAVLPEHHRKGLGRRLMAEAEAVARQNGLDTLRLYTNARFESNIRLYSGLGYAETGRDDLGDRIRVNMEKRLDSSRPKGKSCS